jgi:hypothetical protein
MHLFPEDDDDERDIYGIYIYIYIAHVSDYSGKDVGTHQIGVHQGSSLVGPILCGDVTSCRSKVRPNNIAPAS